MALSPQAAAIADVVEVIGTGWQPDSLVVVELCGNRAARGSLDCASAQRERGVDANGDFRVALTVTPRPARVPVWSS